jgi:hypothetical protein
MGPDKIIRDPESRDEKENVECNAIYHIKNNMYTT